MCDRNFVIQIDIEVNFIFFYLFNHFFYHATYVGKMLYDLLTW